MQLNVWQELRHDFQSCSRTMEHQIARFFMSKQALNIPNSKGVWPYTPTTSIE